MSTISKSAKRYMELKEINDQEPLRIPMMRGTVESSSQKIKNRKYVFDSEQCNCDKAPNCGSTQDYPWTPTEYSK